MGFVVPCPSLPQTFNIFRSGLKRRAKHRIFGMKFDDKYSDDKDKFAIDLTGDQQNAINVEEQGFQTEFLKDQGESPPRTFYRGTSTLFLVEDLTTDDGLLLSGEQLLEARTNWVRDLLSTANSRLLQRISGRLSFVAAWSAAMSFAWVAAPQDWGLREALAAPAWPHELVGGFLSILLVFRTDQAYQRFWEGRRRWAEIAGVACSSSFPP